ncbi:hypothetical protein Tco_0105357 [Tanacetum coccineum]
MIGYVICFIFGIPDESSADIYEHSDALFVDSKVSIVFHQFDRSLMPPSLRSSANELPVTRVLRRLFHLGPAKYITPGRMVGFMQMSAEQQLHYVEEAAGIGSIKKDIASERQHLVLTPLLHLWMNNWKELVTSLSLIVRDIKRKFPKLDPDPDKAEATQIAARGKLERFRNEKSTLLIDILALQDRYIEEHNVGCRCLRTG